MKTKDFFRKFFSLRLWLNLAAMLLVVVLLCLGVKIGIDMYTHHGEVINVPDIRHKQFSDAEHILEASNLKIVVSDTGYVKTLSPDCILEQSPEPGKGVKSGRVIYVVINSSHSPMLTIPDIVDNCSYREARAKLMAMGFKVGPTEYIPGEKDWVYTEPDDYFDEYGDSSAASMPANGELYTAPDHESEVDEFEVVTGPE